MQYDEDCKSFFGGQVMKRTIPLITSVIFFLLLTGCGKYISSYKAIGFVHTNSSTSAEMSFYSFEGTMVFKLKSSGEGDLKYTAKLESGTADVYYDYYYYRTKQELFTIESGEELDSHGGYIEAGTVYIIVETNGECINGEFKISVEE